MLDPETWGQLDRYESEILSTISDVYSGEVLWDDGVSSTNAEAGDRFVDEVAAHYPALRALAPRIKADGRNAAARAAQRRSRKLPDEHLCTIPRYSYMHDRCAQCDTLICPERRCPCPPSPAIEWIGLDPIPHLPPVRPLRSSGPRSLISEQGVVHDDVPGVGWRPKTHFSGIEKRDTTVGGLPRQDPSPGRQPARTLAGTPIRGQGGQPLYRRPFG
jgi:hypothetical protein